MATLVNGVLCDTYAYLDDKKSGETLILTLDNDESYNIKVYLFADHKPFSIEPSGNTIVKCKVTSKESEQSETIICDIGDNGEIIVPVVGSYSSIGSTLFCEIRVKGRIDSERNFVFKATSFRLAIIN